MQHETPDHTTVLPGGTTRLTLRAAFLQRLIDTAHALEGEVTFLRLKASLGADAAGHRPHDAERMPSGRGD